MSSKNRITFLAATIAVMTTTLLQSISAQEISAQDYVVPLFVRADQYGTEHFTLPQPKTGPTKSSFHMEQLIKLESELIGLGEIILETETKLHAKQKAQDEKDKNDKKKKVNVLSGDTVTPHSHNYSRENRFIEKVAELNEAAVKDIRRWVANPLSMFPIRKRLSEDWPFVLDNITECSMVADYDAINDHFQNVNRRLQQDADLKMAYEDLLRLQKTYKIPVSSLARGWIMDEISEPLGLTDIINIAHICLEREDMEGTLEWLLQVAKFLKSMGLQGEDKVKYMNILGGAYLRLDRLQEAKLVYGQLLKEDPKNRIATSNMQLITERMKEEVKKEKKAAEKEGKKKGKKDKKGGKKTALSKEDLKKDKNAYKEEWWMRFCRGDVDPDWNRDSLLKCFVKEIPVSGVRYNIEPISINPPIYVIKDVLSNFTMSKMVEFGSKHLSDRIHTYSDNVDASVPVFETEETYWMNSFTHTMRNLTYQKYQVDSHEQFNLLGAARIYNVAAGGTSNPGKGEMKINPHTGWERNYIGRYMMFLTEPKAGGYFAFPWAKVRVTPERGDVLYWQFRTPWGAVHPRLYHWLECPVLLGDFWYAEQMIEHHNMITHVDFEFDPNKFYIPDEVRKPKKGKKKAPKKKKAVKKVADEDDDEDEDEKVKKTQTKKAKKTTKSKVAKKVEEDEEEDVEEQEEVAVKKTKSKITKTKTKSAKKVEKKIEEEEEEAEDLEEEAEEEVPVKKVKKVIPKKKVATKDEEKPLKTDKKLSKAKSTDEEVPKKKTVKKVVKKKKVAKM